MAIDPEIITSINFQMASCSEIIIGAYVLMRRCPGVIQDACCLVKGILRGMRGDARGCEWMRGMRGPRDDPDIPLEA